MKLSITVDGLSSLSRFDPTPLADRLRSEVERELQAAAASGEPLDPAAHRDALARALARIRAPRARS
jgi:hypothetical protein